jgi:cation transport ATPase
METKLTQQESLSIISQMIEQAKNNHQKGIGNSMMFSGSLVAFTAILNVILAFVFKNQGIDANLSCWVWCLMIPGTFIIHLIDKKVDQKTVVKTHFDSIISATWNGFLISVVVALAILFGIGLGQKHYTVFFLTNPVILTLVGLAEYITAKACRFKPYLFGAFVMWLGALACIGALWVKDSVVIQFFILAVCMILGFVIPGYKLNKTAKENVQGT